LLPVLDVAVTGLARSITGLPRLCGIYLLPWLLGTIALLILEVVLQDQLRLGPAPAWARNIVWAPFSAVAYLMLLRWALDGAPAARAHNVLVGREIWVVAPIVALWFLTYIAVSNAPLTLLQWLVLPPDVRDYRWEDASPYYSAFALAAWLAKGALAPCFFGLIVVVARRGSPDLREHWRLLRLHPVHLLLISLLAAAAVDGARILGSHALSWLGAYQLAPRGMIPWRANIGWAFLADLAEFPLQFLEFAIEGCILAEAYRRLLAERSAAGSPAHVGS
jgi:hypothetical protein